MKTPDSQGWFSAGLFFLTLVVLGLMAWNPDGLRASDLFKTISQAVIITGLINLAASFYYGASKAANLPDTSPPPAQAPPPSSPSGAS